MRTTQRSGKFPMGDLGGFLTLLLFVAHIGIANAQNLKLQYTFEPSQIDGVVVDKSGNGYNGTLHNGAELKTIGSLPVVDLGSLNGYVDMGNTVGGLIGSLSDFSVSVNLFIEPSTDISGNGNFVWVFSTHAACTQTEGKYIAYRVNLQRYAQSTGGWGNEAVSIQKGNAATKGSWQNVVYTQSGTVGKIYINGVEVASGTANYKPSDIGENTAYNWLGRPHFSGDAYLKNTLLNDFRIYNKALSIAEITSLSASISTLTEAYLSDFINKIILNSGVTEIRSDIELPTDFGNGISGTWSSNSNWISSDGMVTRPSIEQGQQTVTLTLTAKKDGVSATRQFQLTVLASLTDSESVQIDKQTLTENWVEKCTWENISLPQKGIEGSVITWISNNPDFIANDGKIVKLPAKGEGNRTVPLTATISKGSVQQTQNYNACIKEDEGYSAYLFAYFTGNSPDEEAIRFALSDDGYNYNALNENQPVIGSDSISDKKGVRDPHILRGHNDNSYYMVVTDMRSSEGWSSNHGIVLLKSADLIHWTHSRIDIKATYPQFSNILSAWAPQTFYDTQAQKYMVYWSMRSTTSHEIIYYAYANSSFTAFESVPQVLYDRGVSTIDGDIIYKDGEYNLFFKTEGSGNGIKKVVSNTLTNGYVIKDDKYLQQTSNAVEGSCVFKLINKDKYILMYDVYSKGRYEFTISDDLSNFTLINDEVSMDFHPRHGTVIPITTEEKIRLMSRWGDYSSVNEINSNNKKTLQVYPQPAENEITVHFSGNGSWGELSFYTLSGVLVKTEKQVQNGSIVDITSLPSAFYILELKSSDGKSFTSKLIKK